MKKVSVDDGDISEVTIVDTCELFTVSFEGFKDIDADDRSNDRKTYNLKSESCEEKVGGVFQELEKSGKLCLKKHKQIFIPLNAEYSGYQRI